MHRFRNRAIWAGLAFTAAGAAAQAGRLQESGPNAQPNPQPNAQGAAPAAPEQSSPAVICIADPPKAAQGSTAPAGDGGEQQPEKPSVVKDVGGAAGGTAGQIAGAAVGGPIGAAAVGVIGEHVGRAVGSVVKGGKKKRERKQAQQAAANAPAAKCAPETPTQQPGR